MADWIKKAIKRPGAFKKKAKAAGETTRQYAAQVLKKDSKASTRTKRQAALATPLMGMNARRQAARSMTG